MRAPFNTTADLIRGPGHAGPGSIYATVPCRLVAEVAEIPIIYPLSARIAYVTMDEERPTEAETIVTGDSVSTDYDTADRIAIPSGTDPQYVVLFVETVNWNEHDEYHRAHVCLIEEFDDGGDDDDDGDTELAENAEHGEIDETDPGEYEWTPPEGVTVARFLCFGAGGGGEDLGVTPDFAGGGGGGGGFSGVLTTVSHASPILYHVGAGGAHGTPGADGDSSWALSNLLVNALGGSGGGFPSNGDGGAGGVGFTGVGGTVHDGGEGSPAEAFDDLAGGGNGGGGAGTTGDGSMGGVAEEWPGGTAAPGGTGSPAGGDGGFAEGFPGPGGGGGGSSALSAETESGAQDGGNGRVVIRW